MPLLTFELDGSTEIHGQLEREIHQRSLNEPSIQRSNRGGWHSSNDLFSRPEPAHREIAKWLEDAARQASEQWMPGLDWESLEMILDGWINVSDAADFHHPHDHPNAYWSGVYFVTVPEGDDGGEIEFLSGRSGNPFASLVSAPMNWDYLRIRPQPGFALLFPGHLKHWVTPRPGDGQRISVAFNAAFRQRGRRASSD